MKKLILPNLIVLLLLSLFACTKGEEDKTPSDATPEVIAAQPQTESKITVIPEVFVTESRVEDNVDSIGIWHSPDNQHWALVTAKATDKILVYNAVNGELVTEWGGTGSEPGKYKRPNGVQVIDDLALIVERDNARVQIQRLPNGDHLGYVGLEQLERPYGLTCFKVGDAYQLYVTDDYEATEGVEPPPEFYTKRVKHFEFRTTDGGIESSLVRTFGDAEGLGRLFVVESIQAEPNRDRLFISDEEGPTAGIKIYTLDGSFTGQILDTSAFKGQAEGLGIYGDYLVTTDQQPDVSVFHFFKLEDLSHVFAFKGPVTTNTDGISVSATAMDSLKNGALWAIHDDQALSCFSLETIEKAMNTP